ncbi:FAD-dependent oxidoreductase [Brachybacterium alimentarium]|uniref:FAD-dependent oxidoreductase n=1 Tax=Brachybacterium alimentarium TaxID=47845 RepID=UPI000DF325B1|nr:FAD-dependent oxidoreductase [Brachybacterium alimentarium]RCS67378.1 pyridine nucleotide-disulfide oxidoreductase [Brachybacterium alimentarium]RCS82703.1 pyridine nucleotide-disulfide oxidoreductase [Brachybacterium alimentarium]
MSSSQKPFRLAVIGSGPAGVYAAETLLRTPQVKNGELEVSIDLFDRFPAPFGLIRYGVAPDHPRIKGIITALHRILGRGDIRFLGDVEFGTDLTAEDLRTHYDAVIFATGALKDADLDIPGIDLEGSHGAADFVAWYDGNPDYPRTWRLDAESVAVIGNGNVALDVARVLSKSADELLRTEIPENVYEGLQAAATTDVHIFGRRGPAQTKFSPLEARELAHPKGLQVVMDPRDVEQITDAEWEAIKADKRTDQVTRTFVGWLEEQQRREAAGEEPTDKDGNPAQRRLHMHFWHRPVEVLGEDGKVTGMRFERTRLDAEGRVQGTGEFLDYEIGAVYRAVGYHGSELPGIPYDAARGVIHNDAGRVTEADGTVLPGVYANGWIKRGPVGLIGATKSDAIETITSLIEDIDAGVLAAAPERDDDAILRLLEDRGVEYTTWEGWTALDEHEKSLGAAAVDADGEPRARVKVVERDEMVRVSQSGMPQTSNA